MSIDYHIHLTVAKDFNLLNIDNTFSQPSSSNNAGTTEKKKKELIVFLYDGQYYLKNPYCELPAAANYPNSNHTFSEIEFNQLVQKKKILVDEDWDETAKAIGFGDMLWIMGSTFAALNPIIALTGNGFFPLVIGPIVGLMAYRLQVEEYKKRTNIPPLDEQKAIFKKNALALTFKVSLAMFGWEGGLYATKWAATTAFAALHFVPHTAVGLFVFHAVVGLGIGLFQGLALMITAMATEYRQHGKLVSSHSDRFKLFFAGVTSGIAWYAATFIPFAAPLAQFVQYVPSMANTAIDAVGRGVVTFLAVTGIFAALHPKQVTCSFITGIKRLFFKMPEADQNKLSASDTNFAIA